jgi:nucleoside-diphosphate-sugar epimerase
MAGRYDQKIIPSQLGEELGQTSIEAFQAIRKRRKLDITAARKLPGWAPRVVLSNGLARSIDWLAKDPAVIGSGLERTRGIAGRGGLRAIASLP